MIKQVQIGAIEYKIVEADIPSICGDCDTMNCRIRINKTMHPTIKRVTLWHELVHGILFTAGQLDHEEQARLKEAGEFKALYEKEQQARTALEAQVAAATRAQLQLDACLAAGLPPSMAARLMGATAEELAQDAKALAEQFKVTPPSTG